MNKAGTGPPFTLLARPRPVPAPDLSHGGILVSINFPYDTSERDCLDYMARGQFSWTILGKTALIVGVGGSSTLWAAPSLGKWYWAI